MPEYPRRGIGNRREATVVLDGMRLKIAAPRNGVPLPLREEIVNIHSRPVIQGEAGPADDPINASWIVTSWLGGGQMRLGRPADTLERFDWAEATTEYAGAATLPPLVRAYDPPAGFAAVDPVLLGDFQPGLTFLYAAWGTDIGRWNETTLTVEDTGHDLAAPALRRGTVYATYLDGAIGVAGSRRLFVPHGSSYSYYDGITAPVEVAVPAIDFATWNEQLFRLTADGEIDWSLDGVTWAGVLTRVPDGSTPKRLLSYLDSQSEPALYVVTDGGIWVVDYDQQRLVKPDAYFPRHPFQGNAADVWRSSLFVGVGVGVHQYQPGHYTPVGLDRDWGLPPEFRGYIKDFAPEYNHLFALVTGLEEPAAGSEETATLDTGGGDGPFYTADLTSNVLLAAYNTFGWHYRWHGTNMTASNLAVSQAQGAYRLWWGAGGRLHTIRLPRTYYNPLDSTDADFEYAETGYLRTSQWNWGWPGQPKVGKTVELEAANMDPDGGDSITVLARFDDEAAPFVPLATFTTNGRKHVHLGYDADLTTAHKITSPNPNDWLYRGEVHEWVQLRFDFRRKAGDANARRHPVLRWHKVTARKLMRPIASWRVVVDLSETENGLTASEVVDRLKKMVRLDGAEQVVVPFVPYDDDKVYMVEVTALNFDRSPGGSEAFAAINLIESKTAPPDDEIG